MSLDAAEGEKTITKLATCRREGVKVERQVEEYMPEGYSLWDFDGDLMIVGPSMDADKFRTIKGILPTKLRPQVVGWRTLGNQISDVSRKRTETWPSS